MAITFVGSHVGTHAATTAQTVNFSSLLDSSGATPTLLQGDIVYVAVENASTLNRTVAGGADVMVPSGYTGLGVHDYRNDSNDSNFRVSRKLMGATPDTSVAIPPSNATTAGVAYAIYVFRGVNATTPESPTIVYTGAINTGVANAAAIIPVTAGSWVVVFGGAAVAAGAAFTNPSGFDATTNYFRSATITTTTNDANIGGAIYTGWTTGSYDPAAFGGSTSTNTGSWSAATLALNPIVTHAATGVLTGTDSAVAGAAARAPAAVTHATTGVLTGQGSLVAGTAARVAAAVSHDATGVLSGVASAIAGSAARTMVHSATGVLAGQGSLIVGSAARFRVFASSGVLTGQGSTVAGSAARSGAAINHAATSTLVGAGSLVVGSASRSGGAVSHDASGVLVGNGSMLTGAASNGAVVVGRRWTTSGKAYLKQDNEILVFANEDAKEDYLKAQEQAKQAINRAQRRKVIATQPKPIKVDLTAIEAQAEQFYFESIQPLIVENNFQRILEIHLAIQQMLEDETIELLLLA